MERGMAMAAFDAMAGRESSPSRSSSGCQSGWTLYLDHYSNGARYVPCGGGGGVDPAAAQRWMVLQAAEEHADGEEDSMASDASSGPRPRLRQAAEDDDEARGFFVDQRSCSSTSGHGSRSSASGSGCLGSSTWSRSSQQGGAPAKGDVGRKTAVVFQADEGTATRPYREIIVIDDDEELDDTASSSAVFSCPMPMAR